jgi:hypothetical protein
MHYLFAKEHLIATMLVFLAIGAILVIPANISFISPFTQAFTDFDITDLAFAKFRSEQAVASDATVVLVNIGRLAHQALLGRFSVLHLVSSLRTTRTKQISRLHFTHHRHTVADVLLRYSMAGGLDCCRIVVHTSAISTIRGIIIIGIFILVE